MAVGGGAIGAIPGLQWSVRYHAVIRISSLFPGLIALVSTACAGRPPPPAPPRTTNIALAISSVTLTNGLRVVSVRDPRATEIQVTMRYAVGAVDDPAGQAGIAHLVEHLMFQQVLGSQSIFNKLETTAREFNAFTSHDATTYIARAPVERLDALLSIDAVRMNLRCTSITEAVFAREREVVINELELRDRSTEVFTALHRGAYPDGHPYAGLLGGTAASVRGLSRAQACAFADAHYAPSNAVLVVSGNIDNAQLEASLSKLMSRIPKRVATAPRNVAAITSPRAIETNAPFPNDVVLFAWPLPSDPRLRARLLAVGSSIVPFIDALVGGRVIPLLLGDGRAEMFAVIVTRRSNETAEDIFRNVEKALTEAPDLYRVPGVIGEILFNRIQQGAIFRSFAGLEEGGDRDARLAAYVLAGVDPQGALGAELASLRTMTPDEAKQLTSAYFSFGRATIAVLKASEQTRGSIKLSVASPVHDLGTRRSPAEASEASAPAAEPLSTREPQGVTTRTLANGLRVILVPLTSVPTVDVRVVFGSGTGDEVPTKRGAATLATNGLDFSGRHINDVLTMSAAGGSVSREVDEDHIAYTTQGLDMHIDFLLAGLRRLVREGRYQPDAGAIVDAMRAARKASDDDGAITDAWRRAIFGDGHAYTTAGILRHASRKLTIADAEEFRATHMTPSNATIVVSGRFDAALADRWIDYLFADWTGTTQSPAVSPSAVQPASIAYDDDTTQVMLQVALPALSGTRAHRLVAAAMLTEIVHDVRHQLGASYSLEAHHLEMRQASLYIIVGAVDGGRTKDAVALIKARVDELRVDGEIAARTFVAARRRVLAALSTTTRSAANLADRVTNDVVHGRPVLSDVQLASEVHALTIDKMGPVLGELDLAGAAILMRGPAAHVDPAFGLLGRTATRVTDLGDTDDPFDSSAPVKLPDEERLYPVDIEDALTLQQRPLTLTFGVFGGLSTGRARARSISGTQVLAEVGVRLDGIATIGLRLAYSSAAGEYEVGAGATPIYARIDAQQVSPSLYLQGTLFGRLHGGITLGANFVGTLDEGDLLLMPPMTPMPTLTTTWSPGVLVGLDVGADLLRFGTHRIGLVGRITSEFGAGSLTLFSIGVGYRYF